MERNSNSVSGWQSQRHRTTEPLNLPDPGRLELEHLPDPKQILLDALARASGLNARRRLRMEIHKRVHLVANYIDDYTPLMVAPAFARLQEEIAAVASI